MVHEDSNPMDYTYIEVSEADKSMLSIGNLPPINKLSEFSKRSRREDG